MTSGRLFQYSLVIMLLLALMLPLIGCAQTGNPPSIEQTSSTMIASLEDPTETRLQDRPSGVLRLWWRDRSNLNPLLDSSASGQAVNSLVFDSLFQVDADGRVQTSLARAMLVETDPRRVLVRLYPDLVFHDGSPVTAMDVKACLDFILEQTASPFAPGLSGVESTSLFDELTIEIVLTQENPDLMYALTFPVIPAASLNGSAYDLVPGTGRYKMTNYDKTNGLWLAWAGQDEIGNGVEMIHVTEYQDRHDALVAFEADQIDLLVLDTDDYLVYHVRNSLRLEPFADNQIFFLSYNTNGNRLLSDSERLLWVKKQLTSDRLDRKTRLSDWCELSDEPWSNSAFLALAGSEQYLMALDAAGEAGWEQSGATLTILAPESDPVRSGLANAISDLLNESQIKSQVRLLEPMLYDQALVKGWYDIAVLRATLPAKPDASWLLGPSRPLGFAGLDQVENQGLPGYGDSSRQLAAELVESWDREDAAESISEIYYETAARSPWSVVAIGYSAVLYGDRVIGQTKPNQYRPYAGIEELWIWSGQSS